MGKEYTVHAKMVAFAESAIVDFRFPFADKKGNDRFPISVCSYQTEVFVFRFPFAGNFRFPFVVTPAKTKLSKNLAKLHHFSLTFRFSHNLKITFC